MIDRTSRDQLIELLNDLAAGRISLEDLLARTPKSRDGAVREIIAQASLLDRETLENDSSRSQKLTGEDRGEVSRWGLFLHTDCEYPWPSLPTWLRVAGFIPSVLTFGLIWRPYRRWFERQGDHRVWPFIDSNEYKAARRERRDRA